MLLDLCTFNIMHFTPGGMVVQAVHPSVFELQCVALKESQSFTKVYCLAIEYSALKPAFICTRVSLT